MSEKKTKTKKLAKGLNGSSPFYKKLNASDKKKENALKLIDDLKGIGKGIWNEDAQRYVNRLRNNDRN